LWRNRFRRKRSLFGTGDRPAHDLVVVGSSPTQGDVISIDGSSGEVYLGSVPVIESPGIGRSGRTFAATVRGLVR
jgi:hypothetical protein